MKQIWKHRYKLMQTLGKGGTGQVYKVWDIHLEKEWAMKEMERDSGQELQILKQLAFYRFPRIVDAFREGDKNFFVMDFIQGISLEEILKKGPLEEKRLLDLGKQIAQALCYLHERTPVLLYLDLKPSNIILDENGEVKLVDLGSVLLKGEGGNVSGTMGFAAPEQIRVRKQGCELNEQADIFSLGMLLFVMAVGTAKKLPAVEEGRRYGVSVRQYNPLISPALEKIIEKCTRGSREKRFSSMRDMEQKLELCQKKLVKCKRPFFTRRNRICTLWRKEWEQERSILCTQGKPGLYFTGRRSRQSFFLWLGIGAAAVTGLMTAYGFCASQSLAQETREELRVVIRDSEGRKVLVKKGGIYSTKDNLFFEIPWDTLEKDDCEIVILCRQEGEAEQYFGIQCQKK